MRREGSFAALLRVFVITGAVLAACPLPADAAGTPPIRHVWVINEENGQVCRNPDNTIYSVTFPGLTGCPLPGFAPYLGSVLTAEGGWSWPSSFRLGVMNERLGVVAIR